jgi:ABC-type glycerol-3-phosphate transport system substrate-binding protein
MRRRDSWRFDSLREYREGFVVAWLFGKTASVIALGALCLTECGCSVIIPKPRDEYVNGRVQITYWEKWTGLEGDAIKKVVDRFNEIQNRIHVQLVTMSQIDRKALVAIAGGDPPDVVGLWSTGLPAFAEKKALMPLAPFMKKTGMSRDDFTDIFIDVNCYDGELYGLPTTPGTVALHWNKRLFREAGLDPDRPPKTLAELDEMAEMLTKRDDQGRLIQVGFSPAEPGWWHYGWGFWFGAPLFNDGKVTFDSPENSAAYKWIASYPKKYGADELRRFQSGCANNFATPQNPFFTGRVAMVLQGVWFSHYIHDFAPNLEWDAAPFPSAVPGMENVTIADCDSVCIPVGARHPDEAFEFIHFLCSREGLEMLCMAQQKFTPLKEVSLEFMEKHPNPRIKLFRDLGASPNAYHTPIMSSWFEYQDEAMAAFEMVFYGKDSPERAVAQAQKRVAASWKHAMEEAERRKNVEHNP